MPLIQSVSQSINQSLRQQSKLGECDADVSLNGGGELLGFISLVGKWLQSLFRRKIKANVVLINV